MNFLSSALRPWTREPERGERRLRDCGEGVVRGDGLDRRRCRGAAAGGAATSAATAAWSMTTDGRCAATQRSALGDGARRSPLVGDTAAADRRRCCDGKQKK